MLKVIFVDDEPWALQGLAAILPWRELGYEVCALCSCGEEALEEIEAQRPDVVFTDIRMPDMSGIELIAKLRGAGYQTAVVIISGYSDFEVAREAVNYHAYQYLLKPLERDKVEAVARELAHTLQSGETSEEEKKRARTAGEGGFRYVRHPAAADIQYYFGAHYAEEISLKKLSELFYLTETYLCDLFKKHTGMTVLAFLRGVRLYHACALLREGRLPLPVVAEAVGYNDYSYFGKLFKSKYGIAPEEYRKSGGTGNAVQ